MGTLQCAVWLLALGLAPEPEPPGGPRHFKTPQAVFDASQAATAKKDYQEAVRCIAPEAVKDVGAGLAVQALLARQVGAPALKVYKPMFDVMDKHGLTARATEAIKVGPGPEEMKKARAALVPLIKKPERFAAEMMAAQEKMLAGVVPPVKFKSALKRVKITGNRAAGVMVLSVNGSALEQKIEFTKGARGWRILPSLDTAAPGVGGVERSTRRDVIEP